MHFRRFFVYLLIPDRWVRLGDQAYGIPISRERLAWIEQKEGLLRDHRYVAETFLHRYQEETGHRFTYCEAKCHTHTPRMVSNPTINDAALQALAADFAVPPSQTVDFVTGHRFTRQHAAAKRQRLHQHAVARRAPYLETNLLLDHLNEPASSTRGYDGCRRGGVAGSRQALLRQALERHGPEAVKVALAHKNPTSQTRSLGILLAMRAQPLQHYSGSRKERTRRAFPSHVGVGILPRPVASELLRDFYDFDLRHAHLAIAARLWDVPEVTTFLEQGGHFWGELLAHFGWPNDSIHKDPIKTAIYAIVYGARDRNLPRLLWEEHKGHPALEVLGLRPFVKHLRNHPLVDALCCGRDRRLAAIQAQGGAFDCYGEFIGIPDEEDRKGRLRPNLSSVLAQEAQAMEFAIASAVLELAQTTAQFTLVHWAHDGFVVHIRDPHRAELWIKRITACVNDRAADYGVRTELELKSRPTR